MIAFALGVLFAVPVTLAVVALRGFRLRGAEAEGLADQMRAIAARMESVEAEVSRAALRADVAETVLIEKGVADEEDLEETLRYFEQNAPARYDRQRDGSLH